MEPNYGEDISRSAARLIVDLRNDLARLWRERDDLRRQRDELAREAYEVDQILGKALGYPYDGASVGPPSDVCTGDHTPVTLAMAAARRLKELQARLDEADLRPDE